MQLFSPSIQLLLPKWPHLCLLSLSAMSNLGTHMRAQTQKCSQRPQPYLGTSTGSPHPSLRIQKRGQPRNLRQQGQRVAHPQARRHQLLRRGTRPQAVVQRDVQDAGRQVVDVRGGHAADVGRDGGDAFQPVVPDPVDRVGREREGGRGQVEEPGRIRCAEAISV